MPSHNQPFCSFYYPGFVYTNDYFSLYTAVNYRMLCPVRLSVTKFVVCCTSTLAFLKITQQQTVNKQLNIREIISGIHSQMQTAIYKTQDNLIHVAKRAR